MTEVLSVQNMRLSDKATIEGGTPSLTLMPRAAEGIYNAIPFEKLESSITTK